VMLRLGGGWAAVPVARGLHRPGLHLV